jgi:hypothetical protein
VTDRVSILVSYGWQPGRGRMSAVNRRLGPLGGECSWRWTFNLATGLDGEGWGGTKVGPDLWAGSFKDFPFDVFAEAMTAADWEDPDMVQVMVHDEPDGPWQMFGLRELGGLGRMSS